MAKPGAIRAWQRKSHLHRDPAVSLRFFAEIAATNQQSCIY
jgi:hypothetical protein